MSSEIDLPQDEKLDDGLIVIRASWLVTAASVAVAFMLGLFLGYFLFGQAYNQGVDDAIAGLQLAANQPPVPQATAAPARIENVSADDDPFLGSEDAPITIVEFSDFECPWCAHFHQRTLYALKEKYGDEIRIVFRDFPMSNHPNAPKAAEAAECADEQGQFWALHDAMFQNQATMGVMLPAVTSIADSLELDMDAFTECVESGKYADEVANDVRDAISYGVTATPTFFINGVRLVGSNPIEQFSLIIDAELVKE